jgi:hypothetical protein
VLYSGKSKTPLPLWGHLEGIPTLEIHKEKSMKKLLFTLVILIAALGCNTNTTSQSESPLPKYTTLSNVRLYTGHGKCGDVLIPSVSRQQDSKERAELLRDIMKKEGWVIISAFSTKEAFKERSCDSFPDRAPAFKAGYLGKIDLNGQFYE